LAGALQICHEAAPGANVLCMLPDTGERYLSTPLFSEIPVDMTDVELAIARSTPNYRFDAPSAAAPPGPTSVPQAVPADAEAFVARRIADLRSRSCCSRSTGASSAGRCAGGSQIREFPTVRSISTRSNSRRPTVVES